MSDPSLQSLLRERLGLDVDVVGRSHLEHALKSRLRALGREGASEADYVLRLRAHQDEFDALIPEVVVPETWFFRYPASFDRLVEHARSQQERCGRRFRVLSWPCSTGEEPLSVAIALLAAGFEPSRFTVDALDASPRAMEHARAGRFGQNAFRGGEGSRWQPWFRAKAPGA